jgi:hypothetical protein
MKIDKNGKWRLYSPLLPDNVDVIGTVTRDIGDTGVLIRFRATGIYAQINAGVVRSINRHDVERALAQ